MISVYQVQGEFNITIVTSQLEPQDHPAPVVSSWQHTSVGADSFPSSATVAAPLLVAQNVPPGHLLVHSSHCLTNAARRLYRYAPPPLPPPPVLLYWVSWTPVSAAHHCILGSLPPLPPHLLILPSLLGTFPSPAWISEGYVLVSSSSLSLTAMPTVLPESCQISCVSPTTFSPGTHPPIPICWACPSAVVISPMVCTPESVFEVLQ